MSLFNELKRRNVFKVGIAYVVVAWLVAQVLQLVFESFGTPDWAIKTVLVLLATGLPFALFFAWAFEMTPDGLKRENEVDRSQSVAPQTGQRLNHMIFIVMALALAYFAYDKFMLSTHREAAIAESAIQASHEKTGETTKDSETEKSIAVLPFVNMSSDAEQEYFSDGISEELLNGLARIESLKVAARTSSFSFKGQNKPIGEIAQVLGVEHILEGSVRKAGSQIRITAQLIRVSDGFHMWSQTYDRELVNIFTIQDEITKAIVDELRVKLDVQKNVTSTATSDSDAYQEYLQGRYYWNLRETVNLYQAVEHFERATRIDPDYADAWLGLGETWVLLPVWEFNDAKTPGQLENARRAANNALELNPASGRAYAVLAYAYSLDLEWRESLNHYKLALQYEPENASIWHWYAGTLAVIGEFERAEEAIERAMKLDPRSRVIGTSYTDELIRYGKYDAAIDMIDSTLAFAPDYLFGWQVKGFVHIARNEFDDARAAFSRLSDLAGTEISNLKTVDYIEASVASGEPAPAPAWFDDPNFIDQYYASFALVHAGQYEAALDLMERQSNSNIPHLAAYWLNSVLYRERMGHLPRYQQMVEQLARYSPDQENE